MSAAAQQANEDASAQENVAQDGTTGAQQHETGTKRPRSNSLEAAAAQALTQLDGPPHLRQQSIGGFQPTLGPPQPMHPSQYANAFSAGQNTGPQQQQQQQPQQQSDATYAGPPMSQSPAFRPNTGSSSMVQSGGSPAGGRAPGAHQARQRTAVACRYCRKRKIRCTGISHDPNDPRCSNCRRLDQECIYAPVGATQGTYTRQPMPDAYGRGQPFHPMPQAGMMQGPPQQWQGYPQPGPYMYGPGRGMPGPEGQPHFAPGQYGPAPGYPPQGQHYQYDNSYPNYVNDPNAAGPQAQGQFGRLKPETFAVYPSPSTAPAPGEGAHVSSVAPDPTIPEPVLEPTREEDPETQSHPVEDIEHVTDPALVAESETEKSTTAPVIDPESKDESAAGETADASSTNELTEATMV